MHTNLCMLEFNYDLEDFAASCNSMHNVIHTLTAHVNLNNVHTYYSTCKMNAFQTQSCASSRVYNFHAGACTFDITMCNYYTSVFSKVNFSWFSNRQNCAFLMEFRAFSLLLCQRKV